MALGVSGEGPEGPWGRVSWVALGGVRRVLISPFLGWGGSFDVELVPDTFGGQRRLENHKDEALLMDVELIKVRNPGARPEASEEELRTTLNPPEQGPYRLPAPPKPL